MPINSSLRMNAVTAQNFTVGPPPVGRRLGGAGPERHGAARCEKIPGDAGGPVTGARHLLAAAGDALLDARRPLTLDELHALAALPDDAVPSLAALAHEVRLAWCGPGVEVEGI